MTTKPSKKTAPAKKAAAPAPDSSRTLDIKEDKAKTKSLQIAELAFNGITTNANTAALFSKESWGEIGIGDSFKAMKDKTDKVAANDMSGLEATLTAQATTLDAMFNSLAWRAAVNMGQYVNAADTYMRLALKAQSQCRTTIETLAELKYPKSATFIKQANIAGQQQVNNGVSAPVSGETPLAHEKTINPSNELLTGTSHAALDTGRTGATIGVDSQLETVGAINRRKVSSRQSKVGG